MEKMKVLFQKRAKALAQRGHQASKGAGEVPVLVFPIGNERYAVLLDELTEVLPFSHHAPIPMSDEIICGIINIRGALHCVLDLPALLGLSSPPSNPKGYVLILKREGIGLRVDQLNQILTCREDTLTQGERYGPHESLPARYRRAVLPDNTIVLHLDKIFSHPIFNTK